MGRGSRTGGSPCSSAQRLHCHLWSRVSLQRFGLSLELTIPKICFGISSVVVAYGLKELETVW